MIKIATIVGTRPQFIKSSVVSQVIKRVQDKFVEIIIHTGQHYDDLMDGAFFRELAISKPARHLGIGPGPHGRQTGMMLGRIEEAICEETIDAVLVYGDTNSTLAGALAAVKLGIPVIHVEAGVRSYNRNMPEEINRIITDHLATYLFCPTQSAVDNLSREGITHDPSKLRHVVHTGDVMLDSVKRYRPLIEKRNDVLEQYGVRKKSYILATIHRAENTDNASNLSEIYKALHELSNWSEVIVPLHPRTKKALLRNHIDFETQNLRFIEPIGYIDMLVLIINAKAVITDSGGVQREAFFLRTPCVTARNETEWGETLQPGANVMAGANCQRIISAAKGLTVLSEFTDISTFGDGTAAEIIVEYLAQTLSAIAVKYNLTG